MGKNEILAVLWEFKKHFAAQYGIKALGVFGSVARDQIREDSDVDVVIQMDLPNLVTLSRIRLEIEETVHKHVDIVQYRERMNDLLKKRIDREAIYV